MTLAQVKPGGSGFVSEVAGAGALRRHLLDMGLTPGVEVRVIKYAPMGDPMEIMVRGYTLSIRKAQAELIKLTERTR